MTTSCPVGPAVTSHKILCEQISEKMVNLTFKYEQACRQIVQLANANAALEKSLSNEMAEKAKLQSKLQFCETELEVTKARLEISRNFNKQMFGRKLVDKANKVNFADNSSDLGIGTSRTNTPMMINQVSVDNDHNATYSICNATNQSHLEHTSLEDVPESPLVATTTTTTTSRLSDICQKDQDSLEQLQRQLGMSPSEFVSSGIEFKNKWSGLLFSWRDQSHFSFSLLHHLCRNGHVDLVKWALDNGADVNMRDALKMTPLMVACKHGHFDLLQMLIQRGGADVNALNCWNETALHLWLMNCSHHHLTPSVVLLLGKSMEPWVVNTRSMRESYRGYPDYRSFPCGATVLHLAKKANANIEVVKALLQIGTCPEIRDCLGEDCKVYVSQFNI